MDFSAWTYPSRRFCACYFACYQALDRKLSGAAEYFVITGNCRGYFGRRSRESSTDKMRWPEILFANDILLRSKKLSATMSGD